MKEDVIANVYRLVQHLKSSLLCGCIPEATTLRGPYRALAALLTEYSKPSAYLYLEKDAIPGRKDISRPDLLSRSDDLSEPWLVYFSQLYAPFGGLFGDIVPLALAHLSLPGVRSDADLQADIFVCIEVLSRKSSRQLARCWTQIVQSLLRCLRVATCAVQETKVSDVEGQ
jgi:hypothetical protein